LLKFVASAGQARRKGAKNRSVWGIHEDFEPLCNAAWPSAAEFQQAPREDARHWLYIKEKARRKFVDCFKS
jgi:hypothetical protein